MQINPPTLPLTTIIANVNNAAHRHRDTAGPFAVMLRPQSFQELVDAAASTGIGNGQPTPSYIDVALDSGPARFYPNPPVGVFPPDTILCLPTRAGEIGLRFVQRREYEEQILPASEAVEFEPGVSVADFSTWCGDRPEMRILSYNRIPYVIFDTDAARIEFLLRWNAPKP